MKKANDVQGFQKISHKYTNEPNEQTDFFDSNSCNLNKESYNSTKKIAIKTQSVMFKNGH